METSVTATVSSVQSLPGETGSSTFQCPVIADTQYEVTDVATRHRKAETVTPVAPEWWRRKKVKLTSELLRRTFTFLSTADNARNARVSLWWKSEALALVWRQVDLGNALQVLAPLEKKGRFYVCNVR